MTQKYPSKYSNGKFVSAAQFISEMICERLAKRLKKDLHYRFWVSEEWEKEYKGQIAAANKLLRKYEPRAIINALLTDAGRKIYSLRAPHLSDIIDRAAKRIENEQIPTKNIERNLYDKGKSDTKPKNILDKLKDIEDGNSR